MLFSAVVETTLLPGPVMDLTGLARIAFVSRVGERGSWRRKLEKTAHSVCVLSWVGGGGRSAWPVPSRCGRKPSFLSSSLRLSLTAIGLEDRKKELEAASSAAATKGDGGGGCDLHWEEPILLRSAVDSGSGIRWEREKERERRGEDRPIFINLTRSVQPSPPFSPMGTKAKKRKAAEKNGT